MQTKRRRRIADPLNELAAHEVWDPDTDQSTVTDLPGAAVAAAQREQPQQQQQPAGEDVPAAAGEAQQDSGDADVPPLDPYDGYSSAYYSESSADSGTFGAAQRPEPLVTRSSDAVLLAVSADKQQGVWAVRYRRGTQRKWRFALLALRFVEFSDGEQLIGYSRGCPCPCSDSSRMRTQLDCRNRPANTGDWLPAERMCSCCAELLAVRGGEAALRQMLQLSTPGDSGSLVQRIYVNDTRYTAVRAGDSFEDWGILDSKQRCCTCPSRQNICDHVHELLPETAEDSGQSTMCADDFEKKLKAYMDFDTGSRSLTCISRLQLPEQLEDDADLLQLIAGGLGIPCSPWTLLTELHSLCFVIVILFNF